MTQDLCKLTLVCPTPAEDRLLEFLLDARRGLQGFTSLHGDGHGMNFEAASVRERVRGRIERSMLVIVLERAQVRNLIDDLRAHAAIPDLAYWVEPVEEFGRFA